jgi:CobQ-like glutamine amidotransferase family enzyme
LITLFELFPNHLNLNGDAGNITVLQKRIEWSGGSARHLAGNQLPTQRPDFVLIGHGSTDAWRQIYRQFAATIPVLTEWMQQGTIVLAVNSGFAALHGLLAELPSSVARSERKSEFQVVDFEGKKIVGYFNSDLELASFEIRGQLFATMLHGPILAKNTWLADLILEKLGLKVTLSNQKYEQVAFLAAAAIELETELAGE